MTRPIVNFRLDAGPIEGLGHLERCLVLAAHVRGEGCTVRFVCRARQAAAQTRLRGHTVFYLDEIQREKPLDRSEESDAQATLQTIGAGSGPDWVVVDHYRLCATWERRVRRAGYRIAAIDDYRVRTHCADLLTSDSPARFDPALNEGPADALMLTGAPYALLGAEYATGRARPAGAVKRILVTFGAADPTGETAKAIEAIGQLVEDGRLAADVAVDAVIGPLNPAASELAAAAKARGQTPHIAPAGLAPLMRNADLVVTSGGNSLVEALALLRPCIVAVTADNQQLMAIELQRTGLIRLAGARGAIHVSTLADAIAEVAQSIETWVNRIEAARPFDHFGAQRVGDAMLSIAAGKPADSGAVRRAGAER
ncbi:MAG: UDP-2,4-diacetamido-2,4,6-trideoxy-beta-L-altropyranose hydrolase [Sphingosinicella sp.]